MNRSTLILIILLIVLGAVVYLFLPSEEEQMSSYTKPTLSFAVDSAAVIRVDIDRPQDSITIENVGGHWTITSPAEYAADPTAVSQLIGSFANFTVGSLISDNPAKQGLFQVDSTGTLVTLTERSGDAHSIVIGKMGPSFSEVYFRLPDRSDVYLGGGITSWSLNKDVKGWRDRTIYALPTESITGVTMSVGSQSRSFTRDSTGWKSGREQVPNETINPVLATLSRLRADDFIDSPVEYTGAPARVTVTGAADATLDLHRLASDTSKYAVESSGSPQKFIVSSYTASQLLKPIGMPAVAARTQTPPVKKSAEEPVRAPARETESVPAREEPKPAVVTPPAGDRTRQAEPVRAGEESEPAGVNPFKQRDAGESRPSITPSKPAGGGGATEPAVRQPERKPVNEQVTKPPTRKPPTTTPAQRQQSKTPERTETKKPAKKTEDGKIEDEGDLIVHVVKRGETMTSIAAQYTVSVEQILKWNLLKSISVKPGQELYIFVRK